MRLLRASSTRSKLRWRCEGGIFTVTVSDKSANKFCHVETDANGRAGVSREGSSATPHKRQLRLLLPDARCAQSRCNLIAVSPISRPSFVPSPQSQSPPSLPACAWSVHGRNAFSTTTTITGTGPSLALPPFLICRCTSERGRNFHLGVFFAASANLFDSRANKCGK